MDDALLAFPIIFVAGYVLLYSAQRTAQIAGLCLCLAGLIGSSAFGEAIGPILLLVAGILVWGGVAYYRRWNEFETNDLDQLVECPHCGRRNGPQATICPRCYKRLITDPGVEH